MSFKQFRWEKQVPYYHWLTWKLLFHGRWHSCPTCHQNLTLTQLNMATLGQAMKQGAMGRRCCCNVWYSGKKSIRLWCYTHARKVSTSVSKSSAGSKFEQHSEKLSEVDDICTRLSEKHSGKYSKDQLRAWAHMIKMGKHHSYDEAPDKPFLEGLKVAM